MKLLFSLALSSLASLITVGTLLLGCAPSAHAAPRPALAPETDQATLALGRKWIEIYHAGRGAELWANFSEPLRNAIGTPQRFDQIRAALAAQLGVERAVEREESETRDGVRRYSRTATFEHAAHVRILIGFDAGERIVHFRFIPPPMLAPSTKLDYRTRTPLRLPFDGAWGVAWGGRTLEDNYHAAARDQRFAYDLVVVRGDSTHLGDGKRNSDYFAWGQAIYAPGAGRVVEAQDGIAENVPGDLGSGAPLGNHVILDHGNGEFSFLAHLRPGSVAVKVGDRVAAGQLLGRCGNSGHSSEPHLHYHLQDSPRFGDGEGLPAQLNDYRADGKPVRRGEPTRGQTIEPAPAHAARE